MAQNKKKSKKPLRMRYFYVTIQANSKIEMVTFKGTMTDMFNQISMRGASIINSIELTEPEYRYMMEKREKQIKQNAENEKKTKENAVKINKEIEAKEVAKKANELAEESIAEKAVASAVKPSQRQMENTIKQSKLSFTEEAMKGPTDRKPLAETMAEQAADIAAVQMIQNPGKVPRCPNCHGTSPGGELCFACVKGNEPEEQEIAQENEENPKHEYL